MIEIIINRQKNEISSFSISGHAESGPYGYDLVCAGVSAVSFGAVNAVLKLCTDDLKIDLEGDGGYLNVIIPKDISQETKKKIELIFSAMIISLQTIERDYGEYVMITEREGG